MGEVLQVRCTACVYTTELYLGVGMLGISLAPIICDTCNELASTEVGKRREVTPLALREWRETLDFEPDEEDHADSEQQSVWVPIPLKCPNAKRAEPHEIRPWPDSRPCPRCGGTMDEGGFTGLWD